MAIYHFLWDKRPRTIWVNLRRLTHSLPRWHSTGSVLYFSYWKLTQGLKWVDLYGTLRYLKKIRGPWIPTRHPIKYASARLCRPSWVESNIINKKLKLFFPWFCWHWFSLLLFCILPYVFLHCHNIRRSYQWCHQLSLFFAPFFMVSVSHYFVGCIFLLSGKGVF